MGMNHKWKTNNRTLSLSLKHRNIKCEKTGTRDQVKKMMGLVIFLLHGQENNLWNVWICHQNIQCICQIKCRAFVKAQNYAPIPKTNIPGLKNNKRFQKKGEIEWILSWVREWNLVRQTSTAKVVLGHKKYK